MPTFKRLDEGSLLVRTDLAEAKEWGGARISRIFNFKARQLTTIYERGGVSEFKQPRGEYSNYEMAQVPAVTSSMTVQNFRDIEGTEEIAEMHAKLVSLNGRPPKLEDVLPGQLNKKLKG
ncbi:MAG: hypothetical protein PSY14_10855 [bacterium]|nr:hypothetical protein [bacterium]